jgi:2-polyprenyl-3-methyl-5-hydroxy-6-metoxy-1,4-benzoquinol methylase
MERRLGDQIAVPGDYQHRALHEGWAAQRFWHRGKLDEVERLLEPRAGDVLVDVGCGSGVLAGRLARHVGTTVFGIDANAAALDFARRTYRAPNLEFRAGMADELELAALKPTKIAFIEVIEHVFPEQARETLRRFHAALPPGGRLVVSTPNERSLWPVVEWTLDRLALAPHMDGDQHVASYTPASLAALGEKVGFRVREQRTVHLVAPWLAQVSWRLAERVHALEQRRPLPFGALALVSFERP